MKRNRYRRALEILKSTDVDKKRNSINEALPTNHTKGVYSLNDPGFRLGEKDPAKVYYPDVDGNWPEGIPGTPGETEYVRPAGYWSGGSDWGETLSPDFSQDYLKNDPTGRSTAGLIKPDGTVMTLLPPGGENFILGPLVDGFVPNHTYDAYTNIGYLQKDTRQFVLLARISGVWKAGIHDGNYSVWNGTSTGLTIYNENFTLEMAQWMKDQIDQGKWIDNVPYFYSGGVPQRPQGSAECPFCPPNMFGGFGFGGGGLLGALLNLLKFGQGTEPTLGTQQAAPKSGDAKDAGFPWDVLGQLGSDIAGALSDIFGAAAYEVGNFFEPLSSFVSAGAAFGAFLLQQQGIVDYTRENPYQAFLPPQDSQAISNALNDVMQTIPRERWENLNGEDLEKINAVLNPDSGPTPSNPDRPETQLTNTDEYHNIVNNIGRSDAFAGQIEKDKDGNEYISGISDNYVFTNDADASVKGAPELIKFFGQSFGAQSDPNRAGGGGRSYVGTSEPGAFDTGPNARPVTNIKLKNMPIRVELPPPSSKGGVKESKEVLTESRKRILREIKKPYKLPEVPKQKYKMNFSGKFSPQNTPDKTSSKLSDDLVASGNAKGQRWRVQDKYWQGYETTERMNVIYDRVGHGNQYWEEIVNENKRKNSWKTKEIQEHLNIMAHEKAMKEENPNYESPFYKEFIEEQETLQADNDPLFKKIADRLKKEIDYPDKPSKNGVPNEVPPEMINGYHPKFGKRKDYYKKLDPVSARSMPKTGDLEIDSQIDTAKNKPK